MSHLIGILFGPGTWGAGGNMVAWVLCGIPAVLGGLWHNRRKLRAEFTRLHQRIDGLQGTGEPPAAGYARDREQDGDREQDNHDRRN